MDDDEEIVECRNALVRAQLPFLEATIFGPANARELAISQWKNCGTAEFGKWQRNRLLAVAMEEVEPVTKAEREFKYYWGRRVEILEKHSGRWAVYSRFDGGKHRFLICNHGHEAMRNVSRGGIILHVGDEFGDRDIIENTDSQSIEEILEVLKSMNSTLTQFSKDVTELKENVGELKRGQDHSCCWFWREILVPTTL